jgi:hypothetical protein
MQSPEGIAIDSDGTVYLADISNVRVQKFDAAGTFITKWTVNAPTDVAIDDTGKVFVTQQFDAANGPMVEIFSKTGTSLGQFAPSGTGDGQLREPFGIDVNPDGDVYVADRGNNRIQRFRDNAGYPRAKAATPLYAPLVIAYDPCALADRAHAMPLGFASCNPPSQSSGFITSGTPDANSEAASMTGSVKLTVTPGSAAPPDDTDVGLTISLTDVREQGTLADYPGELRGELPLQITDRNNGTFAQDRPATVQALTLAASVPCGATPDPAAGSTCSLVTSLDTLVPGTVPEGKRSLWELGQITVLDGGPDGDADTATGNTVFARQGVFVP